MTADRVDSWIPADFVTLAQELTLERFQISIEGRYCLAIITAQRPELEVGLRSQARTAPEAIPVAQVTATDVAVVGRQQAPNHKAADRDAQCLQKLRALRYEPCYLLPLLKYTQSTTPTSFSIGRAYGQDVLLRHKSISRLHATIEIEGPRYFLRDHGSHNHTLVNGQKIERAELQPGDSLRFGSIDAVLCTTRALWYAVRATPPKTKDSLRP